MTIPTTGTVDCVFSVLIVFCFLNPSKILAKIKILGKFILPKHSKRAKSKLLYYIFERKLPHEKDRLPLILQYYPQTVALEVSLKCNLHCSICERHIFSKHELNTIFLPYKVVKERIAPIFPYIQAISFTGLCEPILHPEFWDIHALVKNYGVSTNIFSNGFAFSEKHIKNAIAQRTNYIFLSLNSLRKEVYETIKTGSQFEIVSKNIENLVSHKRKQKTPFPKLVINFALEKHSIEEIISIIDFAKDHCVNMVYFTGIISHVKQEVGNSIYFTNNAELGNLYVNVREYAASKKVLIRLPEPAINRKYDHYCPDPFSNMYIFSNGDVGTCPHFRRNKSYYFCVENGKLDAREENYPNTILANIYRDTIIEIWNSEKYQEFRKRVSNSKDLPCSSCYFKYQLH